MSRNDCADCGVRHDYCVPSPQDGWEGGITLQEKDLNTGVYEPRDLTSVVSVNLELINDPDASSPVARAYDDTDPEVTIVPPATSGRITWAVLGVEMEAVMDASARHGVSGGPTAYYRVWLDWGDGRPETVLLGRVTAAGRKRTA